MCTLDLVENSVLSEFDTQHWLISFRAFVNKENADCDANNTHITKWKTTRQFHYITLKSLSFLEW